MPSSAWSVASSDASRTVTRFPVGTRDDGLVGQAPTAVVGGIREFGGVLLGVPHRVEHDRPGAVGALHDGQAIATPAGCRCRRIGRGHPPSRSQIPSWYSPNVSWSGTDQPVPRRVARSAGSVTAIGASPAVYLSAWRICSVDSGILVNSASTAGQPPAVWMGVTKPKPVVYGNVNVSRRIAGVRSRTFWTSGSLPLATTSRSSSGVRLAAAHWVISSVASPS